MRWSGRSSPGAVTRSLFLFHDSPRPAARRRAACRSIRKCASWPPAVRRAVRLRARMHRRGHRRGRRGPRRRDRPARRRAVGYLLRRLWPCGRGLTSHCLKASALAAYGFGGRCGGWGGMVSECCACRSRTACWCRAGRRLAGDLAGASDNLPGRLAEVAPHLRANQGVVLVVGGAARSIGLFAAAWPSRWARRRSTTSTAIPRTWPSPSGSGPTHPDAAAAPVAAPPPAAAAHALRHRRRRQQPRSRPRARHSRAPPGGVCTAVGLDFHSEKPLPLWHMYLKGTRLHVGVSIPGPGTA